MLIQHIRIAVKHARIRLTLVYDTSKCTLKEMTHSLKPTHTHTHQEFYLYIY